MAKSSPKPMLVTILVSPKQDSTRIINSYRENYQVIKVDRSKPKPILLVMEHGQELRVLAGQSTNYKSTMDADSAASTPSSKPSLKP